jgi:methylenetetrahydrofolate dehydrogenase (NADP+) / methenyltetrahydrofolate cyclohydrolase
VPLIDSLPKVKFNPESWIDGKKLMGKRLAELVRNHIKEETAASATKPGLAVILVGDDTASQIYVSNKEKAAQELGFSSQLVRLPAQAKQEEIVAKVHEFNHDPKVHGILVQLPLPKHINERQILQAIVPEKDADGFHYLNQGKLLAGEETVLPCTPAGITLMLMLLGQNLTGKHAVVVGRSNIVGKPMAQLLLSVLNMTVTTCHSKTQNLPAIVQNADILVSATGVRGVVDANDIKPSAIVIDVGMHRIDGKLTGDLDLGPVAEKASYYTPVPGGVGPMTIAMLLYNTYRNALALQSTRLIA